MKKSIRKILEKSPIEASAPCRIDMGGTLDISTFYYPMRHLAPCTVNIALSMRTRVRLLPFKPGKIKISSRGFRSAIFNSDRAPFSHPLGLMFAIAAYFNADGIHIDISSGSPPRSALGGSSVAAVALLAALSELQNQRHGQPVLTRKRIAILAQTIEESVAGIPCGFQDQLAAAYGGVNIWQWHPGDGRNPFIRRVLIAKRRLKQFQNHILVAYCGIPHESRDINGRWVQQFLAGQHRAHWAEIAELTSQFASALSEGRFGIVTDTMNRETAIRRRLTPDVLDSMGRKLVKAALSHNCGARFTGAGGGGCLWAVGEAYDIKSLRGAWQSILSSRAEACLLDSEIDSRGLVIEPAGM